MGYKGAYNFGLSKPRIAKYNYDEASGTVSYTQGFACGEAVNTAVTPAYAEASLYGDNKSVEELSEFSSAAVTLGVTRMPLVAANVLFGHAINEDELTEKSNSNDNANFVGYGFTTKNSNGTYDACVLFKVKFAEGEDSYATKADSITFKQPTITGKAVPRDTDSQWREKKYGFASEAAALAWIDTKLGLVEQVAIPVASVKGGEYDESQTVELTTATAGASIYYTTNGTTPSASNGTLYSTEITVAASCAVRAIAVKSGSVNSEVMTEEYIIA